MENGSPVAAMTRIRDGMREVFCPKCRQWVALPHIAHEGTLVCHGTLPSGEECNNSLWIDPSD